MCQPGAEPDHDWLEGSDQQSASCKITALVGGHLVVSVPGSVLLKDSFSELLIAATVAMYMAQANLLGIWGGLGRSYYALRVLGMVAGAWFVGACVAQSLSPKSREMVDVAFTFLFLAFSIASLLWLGRHLLGTLGRPARDGNGQKQDGHFRFTIRDLLGLTVLTAFLMLLGKIAGPSPFVVGELLFLAIASSLYFVPVTIACLWALLGSGRVGLRSCIVAVATPACVLMVGLCMIGFDGYLIVWAAVTFAHVVIVMASLAVVRSSGYRLMRR